MKRWYYIVLGLILIGGIVYIYMHRQELGLVGPSLETSNAEPSPLPAHIVWATVDRSPEGFKLEMPQDTREIQIPAYNELGGTDQVEMIYSYPDSATSFSVAWADNPPVERAVEENPQQTLDFAQEGALARTQTVLVNQSSSQNPGYLLREFSGRNEGGGVFNARLILAGRRLYMLMAAFPAASARRDSDVTHFFDSFQLVPSVRND